MSLQQYQVLNQILSEDNIFFLILKHNQVEDMKKTLAIALIVISLIGISGCLTSGENAGVVNKSEDKGLPQSLDQYYQSAPPQPPEYLLKMFELGETMVGISINIHQNDM